MKKTKFTHLTILSLIFFSSTNVFLSHSPRAYSKDNSAEPINTENTDFNCYKKYPEMKYPEAKYYCYAIANTKIAEKDKIWKNLTAITKDNKKIIWEDNKVNSRLLVASWANGDRYQPLVGQDSEQTSKDIWVTVAPELKDFCNKLSIFRQITLPKEITLSYRINQLLGLPPEDSEKQEKRKVVQIWVEQRDLFRPTPDPEITDHEAELNFPEFSWFMSIISDKYKNWFLNQLMTNDYPWTKLGYTYDWGKHSDWEKIDPKRPVNVGLSEFIIREKALIKIDSVSKVDDYCK
ncbi:MAG: hypothetical protein V7L20_00340 [Nostoc sp.]|uniref:hypothetical protein n=1 Tax=Nostoc sp. TaxID=1180 RepID=UPI002FF7885E